MTDELKEKTKKTEEEKLNEELEMIDNDFTEFHQSAISSDEGTEKKNKKKSSLINGFLFLGKSFWSQWRVLMSVTFIFTIIIIFISLLTWGFDSLTAGDNFNITSGVLPGHTHHLTFFESLWWVFITISTIGYGDVYPVTDIMKIWAMFIGIIGIVFVSLYTAIVVNGFSIEMQRNLEKRRERREKVIRKHENQLMTKDLRKQLKAKELEVEELMYAISTFSGKTIEEIQEALREARMKTKKDLMKQNHKNQKTTKATKATKTTKATNKK